MNYNTKRGNKDVKSRYTTNFPDPLVCRIRQGLNIQFKVYHLPSACLHVVNRCIMTNNIQSNLSYTVYLKNIYNEITK
jgi:hypothetical protein